MRWSPKNSVFAGLNFTWFDFMHASVMEFHDGVVLPNRCMLPGQLTNVSHLHRGMMTFYVAVLIIVSMYVIKNRRCCPDTDNC